MPSFQLSHYTVRYRLAEAGGALTGGRDVRVTVFYEKDNQKALSHIDIRDPAEALLAVDMLRNEKPVFLVETPTEKFLSTSHEDIGEEET